MFIRRRVAPEQGTNTDPQRASSQEADVMWSIQVDLKVSNLVEHYRLKEDKHTVLCSTQFVDRPAQGTFRSKPNLVHVTLLHVVKVS
jgi:hypothetical protein